MMPITLRGIIDEDFVNYKIPSMVLMFPYCNFKCGEKYCQNAELINGNMMTIDIYSLCERYINNKISKAVICQGMEPFDSFEKLFNFVFVLREEYNNDDDIVIYTGYTEEELIDKGYYQKICKFKNIIIKYGRFIPNQKSHYDSVLGVNLASDNQYARRIS